MRRSPIQKSPASPVVSQHPIKRGVIFAALGLLALLVFLPERQWDDSLYVAAAEQSIFTGAYLVSTITLWALVALWAVLALWLLWTRQWPRLSRLAAGGVGSVIAYIGSEIFKSSLENERPCQIHQVYLIAANCPAGESWSYPSNHTVIAFSLAVAVIAAFPVTAWIAAPLAIAAGISRVFAGHHFPQDVLAGAGFGSFIALACLALLLIPTQKVSIQLEQRFPAKR